MTLGDAQGFQRGARVNLHFQAGENIRAFGAWQASRAFSAGLYRVLTDENILGDRQFVEQHGFLVNGGDPHLVRRFRVGS
jgi:hypothetical protein